MEEKYIPLAFEIDYKTRFKTGELVKIVDQSNNIIQYGYVAANSKQISGVPFVEIMSQRDKKIIKLVVTNAIQKI